MTIGIDLDDTITNSSDIFLKYAKLYNKTKKIIHDIDSYELEQEKAFGWNDNNKNEFREKYLEIILNETLPRENCVNVINELHNAGHKIIIITARKDSELDNIKRITENWLAKYNISYDLLCIGSIDKEHECAINDVDLFIDDNYNNCFKVYKATLIPTLLYNTRYNRNIKYINGIERVYDWLEIKMKIEKLSKKKILEYIDIDDISELPKVPTGVRYVYFYGGTKNYRAYIAPNDMLRADFMEIYPEYIPIQNQPIYNNNGIIVRADPKYPCPGFYIFALDKTYRAFDLMDDVAFLRFSFILKKIKEGMRSELNINYAHLLSNEKSDPYVNVHFWLVPVDGDTSPDLLDFDVKKYLESFKPKEQIDRIISYNNILKKYIDKINLVKLDNSLMEKLKSVKK